MIEYNGKSSYYGEIAKNYEKDRVEESIWEKETLWVEKYLAQIQENSTLLDLPVGSGRFIPLFSQKKINVLGLDISSDMIAEANAKLIKVENSLATITLHTGDAENIGLENNSMDYILCFRLFHLIPLEVIQNVLAEFYRISKKEVVIQIYNTSLNNRYVSNERLSIFKKVRKFINKDRVVSVNTVTSPWGHISNSSYSYYSIIKEFEKCGFIVKKIDYLADKHNPATIFILQK